MVPGAGVGAGEQGVGAVDLVADGAEVLPTGPRSAPRAMQYCISRAAWGWSA
jgi:hypothetical protein